MKKHGLDDAGEIDSANPVNAGLRGKRMVMVVVAINQPRVQRRIDYLKSQGMDVTAYAFDRQLYSLDAFLARTSADIRILGSMGGGVTVSRLWIWLRGLVSLIGRELFRRKDFIYYMGFDGTLIDLFMGRGARIYEISDLRFSSKHAGWIARALCCMENCILRRSQVIVVTSKGFEEEISQRVGAARKKTVLLENRIPQGVIRRLRRPEYRPTEYPIRIGYVGFIRYVDMILAFAREVARRPSGFEFHLFGNGYDLDDLRYLCDGHKNLTFHGRYRNPEDLAKVHSGLDVGFAVYGNRDHNVRVAIPNKLFEHAYFGTPLLVASGTALSKRVEAMKIGFSVDPSDANWPRQTLDQLDTRLVDTAKRCCMNVEISDLTVNMEPLASAMLKADRRRGVA